MKCELIIDSSLLTENDMVLLNEGGKEIQCCKTDTNHFFPPEVILILIDLSQNMAYSAAYDTVKYALGKLVSMFTGKRGKEKTQTKMEIACGDKRYSLSFDFELTEEQKNKLVDAAAKKLLEEN